MRTVGRFSGRCGEVWRAQAERTARHKLAQAWDFSGPAFPEGCIDARLFLRPAAQEAWRPCLAVPRRACLAQGASEACMIARARFIASQRRSSVHGKQVARCKADMPRRCG